MIEKGLEIFAFRQIAGFYIWAIITIIMIGVFAIYLVGSLIERHNKRKIDKAYKEEKRQNNGT